MTTECLPGDQVSAGSANGCELLTFIRVYDVRRPFLAAGIEESGRVDLGPYSALPIEAGRVRRSFGDVDLHRALVSSRNGVFARALRVLMPLEPWCGMSIDDLP